MERRCADVDVDIVAKEVLGQTANLLGPGCGPHETLTVGSDLLNDFADLRFEAHVEHSVEEK
jgi:hypothetical protein